MNTKAPVVPKAMAAPPEVAAKNVPPPGCRSEESGYGAGAVAGWN